MENYFILPQSKFEELILTLKEIKSLVLEIRDKPKSIDGWISEKEAQKLLGLKETSLWTLRKRRQIIFSKIGSRVFYSLKSIESLIRKNEI